VDTNVRLDNGEIDLLAVDGKTRVAVEVRTTRQSEDPIDAVGEKKRQRVRGLAGSVGAHRVDFIGVRLDDGGIDFHWLPGPN
jgi:Holliday junction resolvase-like predicted endonuclease